MNALLLFFFLLLISPPASVSAASEAVPIEVTYVANMGYLLRIGDSKILIDSLYTAVNKNYSAPTEELRDKIIRGVRPFDRIALVLATHRHPDHFQAATVLSFLQHHPESAFLGPPQTIEDLQADLSWNASLQSRIHTAPAEIGKSQEKPISAITVRSLATDHDGGKTKSDNFMYLIKVNDRVIFHEGDARITPTDFSRLRLEEEKIDLAILHEWYIDREDGRTILKDYLRPKNIILSHALLTQQDLVPGKVESMRAHFPGLTYLQKSMEKAVFRDE